MKTFLVVVLLLVMPCLAAAQTAEQEVTALERTWIDAATNYDVAWFERVIADTFSNTSFEGVVTGKAATVADVKNKAGQASYSYENLKVQVYGDTAIATGITANKGTFKGKDSTGRYAWTDTWVRRGGQWQCVASHASRVN